MFKKKSIHLTAAGILLAASLTACQTVAPLAKVNLDEPGWKVVQGQAVYRPKKDSPDIAGEIIVATRAGQSFIQFTKTPFPLIVAQTTTNAWQIELPSENRRYAGGGAPPQRIGIWVQLPRALAGSPLPKNWTWRNSAGTWRLENISTAESLEGYFNQ